MLPRVPFAVMTLYDNDTVITAAINTRTRYLFSEPVISLRSPDLTRSLRPRLRPFKLPRGAGRYIILSPVTITYLQHLYQYSFVSSRYLIRIPHTRCLKVSLSFPPHSRINLIHLRNDYLELNDKSSFLRDRRWEHVSRGAGNDKPRVKSFFR